MAAVLRKVKDVPPADLASDEDMKGVELLPLITDREGAGHFAMRLLRVAPGGYTPFHEHPWEHEVYVLRGSGELMEARGSLPLLPGTAVFVPAGDLHRFRAGDDGLDFLCCIPLSEPKG